MYKEYLPDLARIREIKDETSNIKTLSVELKNKKSFKVTPGQFVDLTIFGYGEFPASVSTISNSNGHFQATIQEKGRVTENIKDLKVGSTIGVRGPYGRGYSLEEMKGKNIYIVTGGIGLAAVWLLIDKLTRSRKEYGKLKLLHGARTPSDLIYKYSPILTGSGKEKYDIEVLLTVDNPDNDWNGYVGVVPKLFDETEVNSDNAIAVMCGPSAMMKYSLCGLMDRNFSDNQLILSFERRMQCGVGVCGHCMIGRCRVCKDGPVFHYNEIKNELDKIF